MSVTDESAEMVRKTRDFPTTPLRPIPFHENTGVTCVYVLL